MYRTPLITLLLNDSEDLENVPDTFNSRVQKTHQLLKRRPVLYYLEMQ